jgi:hypothetical protein
MTQTEKAESSNSLKKTETNLIPAQNVALHCKWKTRFEAIWKQKAFENVWLYLHNQPTVSSRIPLGKRKVAQQVSKFPASCETLMFIVVFITARLCQMNPVYTLPYYLTKFSFNVYILLKVQRDVHWVECILYFTIYALHVSGAFTPIIRSSNCRVQP